MTGFISSEQAEDAFYDALRSGDADTVSEIWADEDEIVCIHPNGPRLTGNTAVQQSWSAILESGGIDIRTQRPVYTVSADIAVHNLVERITISDSNNSQTVFCYATNIYVRDASGWKMVMHHAAPALDDSPPSPRGSSEILH